MGPRAYREAFQSRDACETLNRVIIEGNRARAGKWYKAGGTGGRAGPGAGVHAERKARAGQRYDTGESEAKRHMPRVWVMGGGAQRGRAETEFWSERETGPERIERWTRTRLSERMRGVGDKR